MRSFVAQGWETDAVQLATVLSYSGSPLPLRVGFFSANLRIPIRRRIREELSLPAEVAHCFFINLDAQARACWNGDVPLNDEVTFVR